MAKALDYLHDGCEPPIIHRNFNSSNILLSKNFEVRLSDFVLAVNFNPSHEGESHMSNVTITGTLGYMDPQYLTTGMLSTWADVYGFGAVLMEIIAGRPAYQYGEDGVLTQWVSSMFGNGEIGRIMDPKLEGDFDVNSVMEALNIAFACLSCNSNDRPTMGEVQHELHLRFSRTLLSPSRGKATVVACCHRLRVSPMRCTAAWVWRTPLTVYVSISKCTGYQIQPKRTTRRPQMECFSTPHENRDEKETKEKDMAAHMEVQEGLTLA
ncbi:hypothetical protein Csa_001862 [Cucumis sativus]|nr:hypothetical protein Csa_001862 [Cucumis sativus]